MKEKTLKLISYIYILIPIIIFVLGWCKPIISIPITIILAIIFYLLYKQTKEDNDEIFTFPKEILYIFIITTLICIWGGHGGFFYQSSDWNERNAVLRDLINMDWPVYYSINNTALDYYIGQWMVPAIFGKIFIGISQNLAWRVGNIVLLIWNSIGITICLLWVINKLKLKTTKSKIIATLVFLFFSGLDIVGILIFKSFYRITSQFHIDWWASIAQYSSMITQLFWVFNQVIVPWIVTLLLFNEKNVKNYMVFVLFALPFGPLPFVGLSIVFGINALIMLIKSVKNKEFINFIKDVFSIQNILAFISILPIFLLYYMANTSASSTSDGGGFGLIYELFSLENIEIMIIFFFLEFGIYNMILWKKHRKNPMYYIVLAALIIIPFFKLGYGSDFCMRVSIPALVIIDYWVVEYLFECYNNGKKKILIVLSIILCIGAFTPVVEFSRGIYVAIKTGKTANTCDYIKSFSVQEKIYENFETVNPKEDSIFFKYIARK